MVLRQEIKRDSGKEGVIFHRERSGKASKIRITFETICRRKKCKLVDLYVGKVPERKKHTCKKA